LAVSTSPHEASPNPRTGFAVLVREGDASVAERDAEAAIDRFEQALAQPPSTESVLFYLWFSGDSKGIVFGVFGPTWVDLSDEEEYESDEEVFESRVRVLRKAAAAEVYAFATTDNDLVVATRA
jgi:hypothetical protein